MNLNTQYIGNNKIEYFIDFCKLILLLVLVVVTYSSHSSCLYDDGLSQQTRGGNSKLNRKRRLKENFFSLEKTLHD